MNLRRLYEMARTDNDKALLENEAKRIKSEFTVSKDEDSVPTTPLPNAQGQVPKSSLIDKNKLNYLYKEFFQQINYIAYSIFCNKY